MTASKKVFSFVFLALFMFGFVGSINAEEEEDDFPSNTGYWIQSGNNTYYCEWSFFSWVCQSGSTSDGPPEESGD